MDELKNLTRAQKEQLIKTLQTKQLLKKERVLEDIEPHPGQQAIMQHPAKIRALFCGNSFGKSWLITVELLWTHLRRHPYRKVDNVRNSWLLIPGLDKAQDYVELIKKLCPPSQLPHFNKLGTSNVRRFDWQDGSYTTIYSHDQDSIKLEGTNIDMLVCDEPPPRNLWIAAFRGLRNNADWFILLAGTPISQGWLVEDIYEPWLQKTNPDIEVFKGSSYDNPYVSKDFLEQFESQLTEEEKKVRIHGEFAVLQGRVFKEFNHKQHVILTQEWPKEWPVYMACDPHQRKASTAVWIGVTPDEDLVVLNETKAEDIPGLAKEINAVEKQHGYKVVLRRIDNSGSSAGWRSESAIEILRENGIRVSPMRPKEKAVADGIMKIRKLFIPTKCTDGTVRPRLQIMDSCRELIKELNLYSWDAKANEEEKGVNEKPKKTYDDFVDPLRYIVMSNPRFKSGLEIGYTGNIVSPYGQKDDKSNSNIEVDADGRIWRG